MPKRKHKQQEKHPKLTQEQFNAIIDKYSKRREELKVLEPDDTINSTSPEVQDQLIAELKSYRGSIARANNLMGI